MSNQSKQKGEIKEIQRKKIERHNDNDLKSLEPWNTLWAYKCFSFIAKSCNLHYVHLQKLFLIKQASNLDQ